MDVDSDDQDYSDEDADHLSTGDELMFDSGDEKHDSVEEEHDSGEEEYDSGEEEYGSGEEQHDSNNKYRMKTDELSQTIKYLEESSSNKDFDFSKYRDDAHTLLELMKYMYNIAYDDRKMDWDCIHGLMNFNCSLIQPALEVLGMDPNTVNENGNTALHSAILFGEPQVLKWLLANGADPFKCNDKHAFPMAFLERNSRIGIACGDIMNLFIHNLIYDLKNKLKLKNYNKTIVSAYIDDAGNIDRLQKQSIHRSQEVEKYRSLISGLLEIERIKNKKLALIASNGQLFSELQEITTMLHKLDTIESVFDYESVPGVPLLHGFDKDLQDWYIREELSKRSWKHHIRLYFTRCVHIMKKLHIILEHDEHKYAYDILPFVIEAKELLQRVRPSELTR